MIIFGTRGRESRSETGMFHCPRCGSGKTYTLVIVKRWFTLYFIPVIPLNEAGRYIQCQSCAATYAESVKTYDPQKEMAKFRATFEIAMLRSMLAMVQADGTVHDGELEQLASIMTRIGGSAVEIEEIREAAAGTAPTSLADVLDEVSGSLNDRGKAMVIQSLYAIASADSELSDSEMKLLAKAGKHLGLGRADVKKIVQAAA